MRISKNGLLTLCVVSCLVLGLFYSCKKDSASSNSGANNDLVFSSSASASTADNLFNDAFDVVTQVSTSNVILSANSVEGQGHLIKTTLSENTVKGLDSVPGCTTVTISPADTSTYPKTVTVDFGVGCTGWYGVQRSGSISFVFSAKYKYPGTTITATFNNYKVNGYKLEGTYSLTNNSSLQNGVQFKTSVVNGKVTYPDGTTYYSYSGHKTITQTGGVGSLNLADYVFSIAGAHSWGASDGRTLVDTITTPLVKAVTCKNISAGIVSFTYNGTVNGTLDYGNGTCDSSAVLTIGNLTKTITLPR